MLIRPDELACFETFLDEFQEKTAMSRAIHLGIRNSDPGTSPDAIARQVMSHLTDEQILQSRNWNSEAWVPEWAIFAYLRANPHLLIPAGFDEIRIEPQSADEVVLAFENESRKRSPYSDSSSHFSREW